MMGQYYLLSTRPRSTSRYCWKVKKKISMNFAIEHSVSPAYLQWLVWDDIKLNKVVSIRINSRHRVYTFHALSSEAFVAFVVQADFIRTNSLSSFQSGKKKILVALSIRRRFFTFAKYSQVLAWASLFLCVSSHPFWSHEDIDNIEPSNDHGMLCNVDKIRLWKDKK